MTPEEIKELARIEGEYRVRASNLTKYDDVMEVLEYAKAAAVIDYIRKDIKSIVADAVKEAVGTLNSDRKPVCPGDTALNDFLKLHLLNCKPKVKIEDRKHTIDNSYFKFRSTRQFLNSYGVEYLEDIKGYTKGNLNSGIVPMIRIGDNPFSELKPIPFDNFEDLKETMDSFVIQFEEIK